MMVFGIGFALLFRCFDLLWLFASLLRLILRLLLRPRHGDAASGRRLLGTRYPREEQMLRGDHDGCVHGDFILNRSCHQETIHGRGRACSLSMQVCECAFSESIKYLCVWFYSHVIYIYKKKGPHSKYRTISENKFPVIFGTDRVISMLNEHLKCSIATKQHFKPSVVLLVRSYNRPMYLKSTLQSLILSDIELCTRRIIYDDGSSSKDVLSVLKDKSLVCVAGKEFEVVCKPKNVGCKQSYIDALDYVATMEYDFVCTVDNDVHVSNVFISTLIRSYSEAYLIFNTHNMLLTGFNPTNSHRNVQETFPTFYRKLSCGGVNYFFHKEFRDFIVEHWRRKLDWGVCRQMKQCEYPLISTIPGVLNHIGVHGLNSCHNRFDHDSTFSGQRSICNKYVYVHAGHYIDAIVFDEVTFGNINGGTIQEFSLEDGEIVSHITQWVTPQHDYMGSKVNLQTNKGRVFSVIGSCHSPLHEMHLYSDDTGIQNSICFEGGIVTNKYKI